MSEAELPPLPATPAVATAATPVVPGSPSGGRTGVGPQLHRGHGFGTMPVFLASISTILGAILFLRFDYAVANVGVLGALAIIALGHVVTLPATFAVSEIATNRRVEGGGVYYIISRSFGNKIGGAIGISLFLSQAVSVAFYIIAFAEAFRPLASWFELQTGLAFDARWVSVPSTLLLAAVVLIKGAEIGVKALWIVVGILGVSLLMFFLGSPVEGPATSGTLDLLARVPEADRFMLVFAIVFPAFTGMTAGVGLSGDLADPRRSIPLGSLAATLTGMVVYVAVVFKLGMSASPEQLGSNTLVMADIALWGPIIPIGLACATVSSAIGSLLVAPRTLQALAADRCLPSTRLNRFLSAGLGEANEPRNAAFVTAVLAMITVLLGSVDFVARMISMFFMVTYGALCAISFLEHFAARPSYRPSFRAKWWVSLIGAIACLLLMFQMDPLFAVLSLIAMLLIYRLLNVGDDGNDDLAVIFQGVMTQATRYLQVKLQGGAKTGETEQWRPSLIMVNERTFEQSAPLQMLTWLCHRYGVGTYLHFMPGHMNQQNHLESRKIKERLLETVRSRRSSVFVETMISPSMRTALAQSLQVPGVSGVENNTAMFEISTHDSDEQLPELIDGCNMAWAAGMDALVLRHGEHFFGARSRVHLWLTWHDYRNANLMILLAYILLGHPDWQRAELEIFAAFPREQIDEQRKRLYEMAQTGRIPANKRNLRIIPTDAGVGFDQLLAERSADADLVIRGFSDQKLREGGGAFFRRHPEIRDMLFVSARQLIDIE